MNYSKAAEKCHDVFLSKLKDYGASWRSMRLPSLTDQIYIKALRVRSIQESGEQVIADSIESEFLGMFNYCVIAMVQIGIGNTSVESLPYQEAKDLYIKAMDECLSLMQKKDADYGQAWRSMRVSSITDIIITKLLRIKQMEDYGTSGESEGVKSNYMDIANYAIFCIIHLNR